MNYLSDFIEFVSSINLGNNYPLFITFSVCCLLSIFIVVSITTKLGQLIDKISVLIFTLITYALSLFKITCDLYCGINLRAESLIVALLFTAISFIEIFIYSLIAPTHYTSKNEDNRLIESLLNNLDDNINNFKNAYSGNNFKRIEFLKTSKLKNTDYNSDYNLNFSAVISFVDKLKNYPLLVDERQLLTDIENFIGTHAYKKLSDLERENFSLKLGKLLRLSAKYDAI